MSESKTPNWVNYLLIGIAILLVALFAYELLSKKVELPKKATGALAVP